MKKKAPLIFILFATGISILLLLLYAKWNKAPASVENADAVQLNAADLFREFSANEQQATEIYNGKVLEVTGTVSSITQNQEGKTIVLLQTNDPLFGINCTMEKEAKTEAGETVTVKGICSGFTTDVILIRCYLINKTT